MTRLLFLCTSNACRSQMAEGFARAHADVEVCSAGTGAGTVHPIAVQVMSEAGVDISGHRSKSIGEPGPLRFDLVITLCDDAYQACTLLPGNPPVVNWGLPDPAAAEGTPDEVLALFRETRDRIKTLVDDLFDRGYLEALVGAKSCAELILDNVSDGIIAHDLDRRIVHFNKAASQITGYSRSEVVGRDCHDVFPEHFCGGKCDFCDSSKPVLPSDSSRQLELITKNGDKRFVEMHIRTMLDSAGKPTGVMVSFRDLTRERALARRVGDMESFAGMIGRDEKMLDVFEMIRDLTDVCVPVLIQGESGTGKELVAAAIHNEGPRADKLFVPVNCGALPEQLLESELFGHVKGAFTGALRDKKGRFEIAEGGTIFLDEIGDIPPPMQVKLLRVLQEGTFERVGGEKTFKVDVRVVSATNKDLALEIAEGRFREDLYYRLNVVPLDLPPLRERRNDIPLLAKHILQRLEADRQREGYIISREAMSVMISYAWPGNVRELQNWLQFAMVKCKDGVIRPEHFPPTRGAVAIQQVSQYLPGKGRRRRKLDSDSVRAALDEARGNKRRAAELLGVSRATLYRFLDDPE